MKRLVCGVGINDKTRPCEIAGKKEKEYNIWVNMLLRCYSKKIHDKKETYIECNISENFKSYSYFYDWCQNQVGFDFDNFHIDKDLLVKGNKLYSEDTCIFLPFDINQFLPKHELKRGPYPIGVTFDKSSGRFRSSVNFDKKKINLGFFDDPYFAYLQYKEEKEKFAKILASRYKGVIDERAYSALMNYTIDIND